MSDRERAEERLRHARRDLEELITQIEGGEIDEATGARLRERYERDVAEAERRLEELPSAKTRPARPQVPATAAAQSPGVPRRTLWIMGAAVVALTVVIVLLARSGGDETAVANEPAVPSGPGSSQGGFAEMEAALAANPDNMALRLALAGLYFEFGDYIPAMQHYLAVIEGEATPPERSVALGRVGFLAYVTEQYDAAVAYVQQGIDADPNNGENYLFMGVIQLYGVGDPEAAASNFEAVLALPDCTGEDTGPCIPPELRLDVEGMLAEARGGSDQ